MSDSFPNADPCNPEAERAVIGSVLINPDVFHECRLKFPDGALEFFVHRHVWIWQAFEQMTAAGIPIDLVTLSEQLQSGGKFEELGGVAYLTSLINAAPASYNAPSYANIVHELYFRRQIKNAAGQIANVAFDKTISAEEVSSKAVSALNTAVRKTRNGGMVSLAQSVASADKIIEANSKRVELPGIPTPILDLNKLMGGGAQDSDLNLIVGRPGQGKTSLLMQIALHAARVEKKRVGVFSMEMPHEQLTMRLLAQLADLDFQMLRAGKLSNEQWARYYAAVEELSVLDVFLDDSKAAQPSYIRARCEILKSSGTLDMVCVDSLNLMRSDKNFGSRVYEAVDDCAAELKNIAREFTVPVWAAHQMNRGIEYRSENAKPKLSDLREGGEQPADGVFFIWHELADPEEKITSLSQIASSEIICGKQRNGPTGPVAVFFNQSRFKFENAVKIEL